MGLKPNIITSCCGSLFGEGGEGIASDLSSLPVKPMIIIFYVTIAIFLVNAFLYLFYQKGITAYASTILSFVLFIVSIASIISFISLYFYEIPTHHCPFDIIHKDYYFIGYPIYIALFGGVFFGMNTGIFEPFKRIKSMKVVINEIQRKWTILSIVLVFIFTVLCTWPIVFSNLQILGQ